MLKADREMGKALARVIAKEEIAAAGTKSESKIKDLEAKIKSPVAAKSIFDKKGGK